MGPLGCLQQLQLRRVHAPRRLPAGPSIARLYRTATCVWGRAGSTLQPQRPGERCRPYLPKARARDKTSHLSVDACVCPMGAWQRCCYTAAPSSRQAPQQPEHRLPVLGPGLPQHCVYGSIWQLQCSRQAPQPRSDVHAACSKNLHSTCMPACHAHRTQDTGPRPLATNARACMLDAKSSL